MKKYKNVLTLAVFLLITIIGCIYALNWHSVYKQNLLNASTITDYIHELKKGEIQNYISDNPYTIIYFGVPGDDNCKRFESGFKKFITNKNLRETTVYINVTDLADDNFKNTFDATYNTKDLRDQNKYLHDIPAIAVYNHITLVDFVSGKDLTSKDVEHLLDKYELGE
jgi:hypothetical protein